MRVPAESLKKSLEDMKQIRQGKQPRKTWDDYLKEQKENMKSSDTLMKGI